jgi:4-carboxymuconolactone decarboxylase
LTASPGSRDLRQAAAEFRRRYYGPRGNPGPPAAMAELAPEVMELVDSAIYGEIYNRPAVSLQTRSLCTIAALTVLGHSPQMIRRHIQGALHVGVTRAQICEIIAQMVFYGGMPAAVNAFRVAKETFDEAAELRSEWARETEGPVSQPEPAAQGSEEGRGDRARSGGDPGRARPHWQYGQSDGGQPRPGRPTTDRPRPAARGRNQPAGDGRPMGPRPKGGASRKRSGAPFPPRAPGRGGGGPGRKRNPGGRH